MSQDPEQAHRSDTRWGALSGVLAALVTPLDEQGRLDHAALERILDHILAAPVSGISPSGSTGEGPLLPRSLRTELVAAVVRRVPAGAAVIPGAVTVTAEDVDADLAAYQDAGATAVLVGPPFYFPLDADGVRRFYEELADRSRLPLVLYNIPAMTKVIIPPAVVRQLADHPMIIGMKDSSRDMEYFASVLDATAGVESFFVLTGTDTLLAASVAMGGGGTIAASVNLVPELACEIYAATRKGDFESARRRQVDLTAVVAACRRAGTPVAWKAALSCLGLCSARPAAPLSPLGTDVLERLRVELVSLGIRGAATGR